MSPTKTDRKNRSISGNGFPQPPNGTGGRFAQVITFASVTLARIGYIPTNAAEIRFMDRSVTTFRSIRYAK